MALTKLCVQPEVNEKPNKKAHRMPVMSRNRSSNHFLAAGHRWF